jgi:hypothetical protein
VEGARQQQEPDLGFRCRIGFLEIEVPILFLSESGINFGITKRWCLTRQCDRALNQTAPNWSTVQPSRPAMAGAAALQSTSPAGGCTVRGGGLGAGFREPRCLGCAVVLGPIQLSRGEGCGPLRATPGRARPGVGAP